MSINIGPQDYNLHVRCSKSLQTPMKLMNQSRFELKNMTLRWVLLSEMILAKINLPDLIILVYITILEGAHLSNGLAVTYEWVGHPTGSFFLFNNWWVALCLRQRIRGCASFCFHVFINPFCWNNLRTFFG